MPTATGRHGARGLLAWGEADPTGGARPAPAGRPRGFRARSDGRRPPGRRRGRAGSQGSGSQPVYDHAGQLPTATIGFQHILNGTGDRGAALVEGCAYDTGYVYPADAAVEEGGDGHLVGSV